MTTIATMIATPAPQNIAIAPWVKLPLLGTIPGAHQSVQPILVHGRESVISFSRNLFDR
jgi:hypothetical protein